MTGLPPDPAIPVKGAVGLAMRMVPFDRRNRSRQFGDGFSRPEPYINRVNYYLGYSYES